MAILTMNINEALHKRKNLKKGIDRDIKALTTCRVLSGVAEEKTTNVDAWKQEVKSAYQSISTRTLNYDILNAAIINSNAVTKVKVSGREVTVAEAIALRDSPMQSCMELLCKKMDKDYKDSLVKSGQSDYIEMQKAVAILKAISPELSEEEIIKRYKAGNTPIIIDPLKKERNSSMKNYEKYKQDIDNVIDASNRKTKIKVEFID